MKIRHTLLLFALALVMCIPALPAHAAVNNQLRAVGKDLMYGNTKIILKGTNFDNIGALGAGIGTNNINDIAFANVDYVELARQGGNHARLGLSFSWYQNNKTLFFQKMDEQVSYARANGIFLLFNMFTTPGNCYEGYGNSCGFWNSNAEKAALKAFWVEMATRYKDESAVAGYDLLNEPTPPNDCKQWFPVAQDIYNAVHAVSPNQLVFVETCSDPGNDLKYNNPPVGANIVYEVHNYFPMDFTHDMFSPGSTYPGTMSEWFGSCFVNKAEMAGTTNNCNGYGSIRANYGLDWADQNNVPIYVGEWGAASVANGYAQYHKDVAELFAQWEVNHAHYTWKHQTIKTGGFYQWGMYSTNPSQTDDPAKLNAVKIAFAGAIRPDFTNNTVPTNAPTNTTLPTSTGTVTQVPTNTLTPTLTRTNTPNPTPNPPSGTGLFYKGINLGGAAITVDGNQWAAQTSISTNGSTLSNPYLTFNPPVSNDLKAVLQDFRQHWAFTTNVPVDNDTYDVSFYVVQDWNDPNPETFTIFAEGVTVGSWTPGNAGTWTKLTKRVSVTDGTLGITVNGMSNIAGIEINKVAAQVTNTPTATATNTSVPTTVPTSTNTSTPTETVTNSPTATHTATNIPTQTATETATATETNTPMPTDTPAPTMVPVENISPNVALGSDGKVVISLAHAGNVMIVTDGVITNNDPACQSLNHVAECTGIAGQTINLTITLRTYFVVYQNGNTISVRNL